jgi:acetyltransferase-like isoleucine patch superfamily enzyme
MKKEIVVIGAGAVAAELSMYIDAINQTNSIADVLVIKGFLDDSEENYMKSAAKYGFTQPYLGKTNEYKVSDADILAFGFSNVPSKKKMIEKYSAYLDHFQNIIHPTSQISKSARLGLGNIVYPHCLIGPNVSIGNFNIFTSYSFISHDCVVGNNNFMATAGLSGNVKIGSDNFFGIRSTILPSVCIGSGNILQAGMVMDKDVSDGETVFYRFKEKVTIINKSID